MNKLYLAGVLLLQTLASTAQRTKTEIEDARQVTALENAWNQAEIKADASGLNLLLGDEFVYTDVDGSLKNRAQWLADVQKESLHYEQLGNQDQLVFDEVPNLLWNSWRISRARPLPGVEPGCIGGSQNRMGHGVEAAKAQTVGHDGG